MNSHLRYVSWRILILASLACSPYAQGITLIKFGDSAGTTTFGLQGWNTLIMSSNLSYTSLGNGGLIATFEVGEYDDYRGVSGTPRHFSVGERIVVTWYNNSDEVFNFTARISFNDQNAPNPESLDGTWLTMRSFQDYRYTYSEIQPHSTAKTVFNITDSGVHKTDEMFSLVNINLAIEWGSTYQKQFLICEKIELLNDADVTPPNKPTGLTVQVISDSKIQLSWNTPTDNVGVVEYLIYMDGEIEGYSRSNNYTCVFLEPSKTNAFSVSALDAAGNESIQSDLKSATTLPFAGKSSMINPARMEYLGALAIPEEYSWGGEAIAYNRDGDGGQTGSGAADGHPGSLFVTNVNQPENGLVGEITIPASLVVPQKNLDALHKAVTLKPPVNIRPTNVNSWDYVDIWRTGLEYVPEERRLYSSWSIHYTVSGEKHASISCCDATDLAASAKHGAWFVGSAAQPPIDAMMSDWLFAAPQSWADAHCSGRSLVVGRCRDGGLSGLGPTLYAFSKLGATLPAPNAELPFTALLQYGPVEGTDNYNYPNSIDGYKHSDDWRGASWLTAENQNAVAIVGNKALGHNWYGYNGERMLHDWVIADVPYPDFYATDPDGKGWRGHNLQPMIIFYDPSDLAKAANGTLQAYEPQPYAALRLDKNLFFGSQHEIFSSTFDAQNRILYVTEFLREADGHLLVHAWRVNADPTFVQAEERQPVKMTLLQNYPNPFNASTTIQFELVKKAEVEIIVYDALGRKVRTIVSGSLDAGKYAENWNATDGEGTPVATGIYFVKMRVDDFETSKKILLLR